MRWVSTRKTPTLWSCVFLALTHRIDDVSTKSLEPIFPEKVLCQNSAWFMSRQLGPSFDTHRLVLWESIRYFVRWKCITHNASSIETSSFSARRHKIVASFAHAIRDAIFYQIIVVIASFIIFADWCLLPATISSIWLHLYPSSIYLSLTLVRLFLLDTLCRIQWTCMYWFPRYLPHPGDHHTFEHKKRWLRSRVLLLFLFPEIQ